jgi:NAD(P)H dehydrogenase (quinone)
MKHLIVLAHPREVSFTRDVCSEYMAVLKSQGHQIVLRDLYQMNFNPVASAADIAAVAKGTIAPDVAEEMRHLDWADAVTFIAPVWWISTPAILKGWIDRVFALGYAYGYGNQGPAAKLSGKKGLVFTSSGSLEKDFIDLGKLQAIRCMWGVGTIEFCGMTLLDHVHFAPVGRRSTPEMITNYLREVRETAIRHFSA